MAIQNQLSYPSILSHGFEVTEELKGSYLIIHNAYTINNETANTIVTFRG